MSQIIGYLMIAAVFCGIFVVITMADSLKAAVQVFAIVGAYVGWIVLACWLISSE
jgi:hypothetical protein